ncbi:MAG TPA: J domain-containing protein [Rhodocyclaceae bacterium]|nr:J domain-containing protein [Rhodocyclaceae bacterium]
MNHYERLELSPNASPAVIKAAYKSLMQRYHPDRSPDSADIAVSIGHAYEVLSDPARRAAYDHELKQLSALELAAAAPLRRATPADASKTSLFLWLLAFAAIAGLGGWMWSFAGKPSTPAPAKNAQEAPPGSDPLSQPPPPLADDVSNKREDKIDEKGSVAAKPETGENEKKLAARTLPIFIKDLTVTLNGAGNLPGRAGFHTLIIPRLGVVVGEFDADAFKDHIGGSSDLIGKKLADLLANADYEELKKPEGEAYLKKYVLDAIGKITATDRFKEHPSARPGVPEYYGVVDVTFAESYVLR